MLLRWGIRLKSPAKQATTIHCYHKSQLEECILFFMLLLPLLSPCRSDVRLGILYRYQAKMSVDGRFF